MVKGNLILISSDLPHSLSKILPTDQQLLPVSLKRKLQYRGSFIEEWVDVNKIKLYFAWFKEHNPLFADVELNEELISMFEKDSMDAATEFESLKDKSEEEDSTKENNHNHDSDTDHDECEECFLSDIEDKIEPMDEIEEMNHTSMLANKYEENTNLPTVANRLSDIIVELEKRKNIVKYHDDDFISEYKDIPIENDGKEQFEWVMPDDEISFTEEDINVTEELFDDPSYLSLLNTKDEMYFSDDENDILDTAATFEKDDIYMSSGDEEDGHDLKTMENETNTAFSPSLDALIVIQTESCLQDSKELFRKLQRCLGNYERKQGMYDLKLLNEFAL